MPVEKVCGSQLHFGFVVLFVSQNSVSIRSVFPLEKSLCTEKQSAKIPEITRT